MTKPLEKPAPVIVSQWTDIEQLSPDELVTMVDEVLDELKRRKWEKEQVSVPFPVPPIN